MEIIKATQEDLNDICKLREELLQHHQFINPVFKFNDQRKKSSRKLMETYFQRENSQFFIVKQNNDTIGFAHCTLDEKPTQKIGGFLQDIYVKEEFRNQGIGNELLSHCKEFFGAKGINHGLTTDYNEKNTPTLKFYEKNNYTIDKIEQGIAHLIHKQL